jgi:PKHD-type hydroxylase
MKFIWTCFENAFTTGHCKILIDEAHNNKFYQAPLGDDGEDNQYIDTDIRDSLVANIPITKYLWLESTLTDILRHANTNYNFTLKGFRDLQVIQYNQNQFFKPHLDTYIDPDIDMQRKLTFIIQLSDPNDYTGGDLLIHTTGQPDTMSKQKGSMIIFPSYTLHEVKPILSGTRYSLIGWCFGPDFK